MMMSHKKTFPEIKPALAKEEIQQSAANQQLLALLSDHNVLHYLRASPLTVWVGTMLKDCLNGQLLGGEKLVLFL